VQDRKVESRVRPFQPAPQDFSALHPHGRIFRCRNKIGNLMRDHDFLRLPAGAPPNVGGAEELRMQRAATQGDPEQGHPRRHQPPRQFVDHSRKGAALPGAADEPFDDRLDRVMGQPIRDRALDHLRGDDIAAFHDNR
jgi:hypothetical protein